MPTVGFNNLEYCILMKGIKFTFKYSFTLSGFHELEKVDYMLIYEYMLGK